MFAPEPGHLVRRQAIGRELPDPAELALLLGHRHQLAVSVVCEAERRLAAEILAAGLLRPLGGADALADPIPLELGEGADDGQEQPRDAVAATSRPAFRSSR